MSPRTTSPRWPAVLVLVCATLIGCFAYASLAPSSSVATPPRDGAGAAAGKLDPALRDALHEATADAAVDGTTVVVNSGWRSAEHQRRLLQDAISQYGSKAEAARWVATPATSPHVSGDAVDVGPTDAMSWLSQHGAAYDLCQIYANEPWHYELRAGASDDGCPDMYADPTQDPRMRR